jgi:hypothetical protein
MKKILYTAIIGRYDTLKTPTVVTKGWEYICFTDDKNLTSDFWKIVYVDPSGHNRIRFSREIKIKYFDYIEADLSIWVDGSFIVNTNLNEFVKEYHKGNISISKHPHRDNVHDEALACIEQGKDQDRVIIDQIARYDKAGYKDDNNLAESGVIIRKHCDEVKNLCEHWWEELELGSFRDQISLPYVLDLCKVDMHYLSNEVRNHEFLLQKHNKSMFNILIRTNNRPESFKRCVDSIKGECNVIVSVHNKESYEYAHSVLLATDLMYRIIEVDEIPKTKTVTAPYNLYLNQLIDKVEDGWIFILDDDDYLLESLRKLTPYLRNPKALYLFQIKYMEKGFIPVEIGWNFVVPGQISMSGFCIHKSQTHLSKFDGQRTGDWRYVNSLQPLLKFSWLKTPMVQTGNKGLRGKSIDIAQPKEPYVYYFTPSSMEKNLGEAYNRYMSLIPRDEDYGCLMDGDTMINDPEWDIFIREVLKQNPDGGMFTCMTNRIGNPPQLIDGEKNADDSIINLTKIAHERKVKFGHSVKKSKGPISGLMMIVKKSIWKEFKFKETGILGVDSDFSKRLIKKYPIYIMEGLYVIHYYRMTKEFKSVTSFK